MDSDEDSVPDADDNCPAATNANQFDTDRDSVGDICDALKAGVGGAKFPSMMAGGGDQLGIAGALVGGFIASALGFEGVTGFNLGSIVIAILGAVLLLLIYRLVVGRRSRSASGMLVSWPRHLPSRSILASTVAQISGIPSNYFEPRSAIYP